MITIGLPRMDGLEGYRRDYTPEFVRRLSELPGVQILIEKDYGADMGFSKGDYIHGSVKESERDNIFKNSDLVLTLTAPSTEAIKLMQDGQTLVSMLHYPTHPARNQLLDAQGLNTISLDELKDFEGNRLVQDLRRTSWNAITEGFIQLRNILGNTYWCSPDRGEILVYLMGFGDVGRFAAQAALKMGNTPYQKELYEEGGNPLVKVIPTASIHSEYNHLEETLQNNGSPLILVDATQRLDPTQTIVPEEVIRLLPSQTIIVDVTADRYDGEIVVKGIQGIPTGNEKKYVFNPTDPEWEDPALVPLLYQLDEENRKTVVSHYAWPSYGTLDDRVNNMKKYGYQILPIIKALIEDGWENIKENANRAGWDLNTAIYLSSLEYFNSVHGSYIQP